MHTHDPDDPEAMAFSRIAARTETAADWALLEGVASIDPTVWSHLAQTLRDDGAVRRALAPAFTVADAVALPPAPRGWPTWRAAAAAALLPLAAAIGWTCGRAAAPPTLARPAVADATLPPELPRLVVDARPAADGRGTEVLYLRRTFERAVVDRVVEVGVDEYGEPRAQFVHAAVLRGPQKF